MKYKIYNALPLVPSKYVFKFIKEKQEVLKKFLKLHCAFFVVRLSR